jgi:hypothetical protein
VRALFCLVASLALFVAGGLMAFVIDGAGGPFGNYTVTDPTTSADPNDQYAGSWTINSSGTNLNPVFSNASGVKLSQFVTNGWNYGRSGAGVSPGAKMTSTLLSTYVVKQGAAQTFNQTDAHFAYGMGDAFVGNRQLYFAGGVNAGGDEGQSTESWYCLQTDSLVRVTVGTVTSPITNTTTTQAVTRSKDPQTIAVADTTGLAVGNWILIDADHPAGPNEMNMEAVKVTALTPTSVTGKFIRNHLNGSVVTGATVIRLADGGNLGQGRYVVNLTQPAYSAGTAAITTGTQLSGVGTTWNGPKGPLTGGTLLNPGLVSLAADDYSGDPFGAGDKRLRAWYPLASVSDGATAHIMHRSQVGIVGYTGNGTAQGSYEIRPGAQIMAMEPLDTSFKKILVLGPNSFTWSAGDRLECIVSPDADVTPFILRAGYYLPGVTTRPAISLSNVGAQTWDTGISVVSAGNMLPNTPAWGTGVFVRDAATGLSVVRPSKAAMMLQGDNSHIVWHGVGSSGIYRNGDLTGNETIELQLANVGKQVGTLSQGGLIYQLQSKPAPAFSGGESGGVLYLGGSLSLYSSNDDAKLVVTGGGDLAEIRENSTTHTLDLYVGNKAGGNVVASFGQNKPVVTGSWSDGSAAKSVLAALVKLGLVTDNTKP